MIFAQTGAGTFANPIGGTGGVTQAGPGTSTLSGANTYTGATTVNGGGARGGGGQQLQPTSTITINAAGTVNLGGFTETVATLNLNGGSILAGGVCNACQTVPYGRLNNTTITSTGGTIAAGSSGPGPSRTSAGRPSLP